MAKAPKPTSVAAARPKVGLAVIGLVCLFGGIGALVYGLAPAGTFIDIFGSAFGGGPPPEDLGEQIDASIAELTARGVWDGVGFVGILAGIIVLKKATAPPKPKPIEELIETAVAQRLATMHGNPQGHHADPYTNVATVHVAAQAAPTAQPAAMVAMPTTAPPPSATPAYPVGSWTPVPAVAPQQTVAVPVQSTSRPAWPASVASKVCPHCGGRLVAGGRICSSCRQTFP